MSLTHHQIYHVYEQARKYLSHLGHGQLLGLALYSVELLRVRHSAAQRVAEGLSEWGEAPVILLVDETKLGQHLSVMVVGVAWNGCCIPLAWRCYQATGR